MIDVSKETCILVYGDSISMPRMKEGVLWSDLYAESFRLWLEGQRLGVKVYLVNRSRGGGYIRDLYKDFYYDYAYFDSDVDKILIIQGGLADCAPRPIPDGLRYVISMLPSLVRRPIIQFLHNNRARLLRKGFKWRGTSPLAFRSVFERWLRFATGRFSKIYIFPILPTNEKIEMHSPGFNKSVSVYNAIIRHVVRRTDSSNIYFLDLHNVLISRPEILDSILNSDGQHITAAGHAFFFKALVERESAECKDADKIKPNIC